MKLNCEEQARLEELQAEAEFGLSSDEQGELDGLVSKARLNED